MSATVKAVEALRLAQHAEVQAQEHLAAAQAARQAARELVQQAMRREFVALAISGVSGYPTEALDLLHVALVLLAELLHPEDVRQIQIAISDRRHSLKSEKR